MTDLAQLTVTEHDLTPTTSIADQIRSASVAEWRISPGGYYAASGRLSNGDLIEMWIVTERMSGSMSPAEPVVYVALNGRCNRRKHERGGGTVDLADWLRGHHTGSPGKPVTDLGMAGRKILDVLYEDCGDRPGA